MLKNKSSTPRVPMSPVGSIVNSLPSKLPFASKTIQRLSPEKQVQLQDSEQRHTELDTTISASPPSVRTSPPSARTTAPRFLKPTEKQQTFVKDAKTLAKRKVELALLQKREHALNFRSILNSALKSVAEIPTDATLQAANRGARSSEDQVRQAREIYNQQEESKILSYIYSDLGKKRLFEVILTDFWHHLPNKKMDNDHCDQAARKAFAEFELTEAMKKKIRSMAKDMNRRICYVRCRAYRNKWVQSILLKMARNPEEVDKFLSEKLETSTRILQALGQPPPTGSDLDWYMEEIWYKAECSLMEQLSSGVPASSDVEEIVSVGDDDEVQISKKRKVSAEDEAGYTPSEEEDAGTTAPPSEDEAFSGTL